MTNCELKPLERWSEEYLPGRPEMMTNIGCMSMVKSLFWADAIVGIDEVTGNRFVVFGREILQEMKRGMKPETRNPNCPQYCRVFNVPILPATLELEMLLGATSLVKGYHQYQGVIDRIFECSRTDNGARLEFEDNEPSVTLKGSCQEDIPRLAQLGEMDDHQRIATPGIDTRVRDAMERIAHGLWVEFCNSGKKAGDTPDRPDVVYRGQGWVSWLDWLGWTNNGLRCLQDICVPDDASV